MKSYKSQIEVADLIDRAIDWAAVHQIPMHFNLQTMNMAELLLQRRNLRPSRFNVLMLSLSDLYKFKKRCEEIGVLQDAYSFISLTEERERIIQVFLNLGFIELDFEWPDVPELMKLPHPAQIEFLYKPKR